MGGQLKCKLRSDFPGKPRLPVSLVSTSFLAQSSWVEKMHGQDCEERYRQYLELVPDAVWRWDFDPPLPTHVPELELAEMLLTVGRVGACNSAYARQMGHTRAEDLVGRAILETNRGSVGEESKRAMAFIRHGFRMEDSEYVVHHGESLQYFVETLVGIVEDGWLVAVWGTCRDITQRKLFEQAMVQSGRRLRSILESVSLGTWTYSPDTGMFTADAQATSLLGLKGDAQLRGEAFLHAIDPEGRARIAAALERKAYVREVFSEEGWTLLPDGSKRWLACNGRYVVDPVDSVERWLGVVQDVTATKAPKEEPRAELVPEILKIRPGDCSCESLNRRISEYTKTPVDVLGDAAALDLAAASEYLDPCLETIFAKMAVGEPFLQELRLFQANGRHRWHRIHFAPMRTPKGEIVKWVGVCTDVDDLMRLGQALESKTSELERLNGKLSESNRDLRRFAAVVAHDLQSPLNAIALSVEELERELGDNPEPEPASYVKLIVKSVARMGRLIRGAYNYSVLDRASRRTLEAVDCSHIMRATLRTLAREITSSRSTVSYATLPTVLGDSEQIAQLFENLIGNAIKYRRLDVAARIHVSVEARDGEWIFLVRDNGIGIKPENAERIFQPFEKLRPDPEGAGMGLAICRRVVEWHGGRIWVESEFGSGSTFYFTLPMHGVT